MYHNTQQQYIHQYTPNQMNRYRCTDNCFHSTTPSNMVHSNICPKTCVHSCTVSNYRPQMYPHSTSTHTPMASNNNAFSDHRHNNVNAYNGINHDQSHLYQQRVHSTANECHCYNQSNASFISSLPPMRPSTHTAHYNHYPHASVCTDSVQPHSVCSCDHVNYQTASKPVYNDTNTYVQAATSMTLFDGIQSNECCSDNPALTLMDINSGSSAPMHSTSISASHGASASFNDSISSKSNDSSPRYPQHKQIQELMNVPQSVTFESTKNNIDTMRIMLPSDNIDTMRIMLPSDNAHHGYKERKSNRGRKKIDRTEFLNVNGRYQCKLCVKSYKRYNDLKGHYAIHDENTECCPHCKKKFSRPIYLRDHIRTHTGEKPFSCDICHKQFAAKRNLVQHRKRHFRTNSRLIPF